MSLAYDYQRAIDAAQTLCELINSLLERDGEICRVTKRFRLVNIRWRLEDVVNEIFIPRRDCLNPDAADKRRATKGGAK